MLDAKERLVLLGIPMKRRHGQGSTILTMGPSAVDKKLTARSPPLTAQSPQFITF